MRKRILWIVVLLMAGLTAEAQIYKRDSSETITFFNATIAAEIPNQYLAERFKTFVSVGGGFGLKTKHGISVDVGFNYMWRDGVKDKDAVLGKGILGIMTKDGDIINGNGEFANVDIGQRCWHISGSLGYIIPLFKRAPNSGLWLKAGGGFIEYWTSIKEVEGSVLNLKGDYVKGYDRLCNGYELHEFIGYMMLTKNRFINGYLGVELKQTWAKCRREFNFVSMGKDTKTHYGQFVGLKLGWIIPIYKKEKNQTFYF